MLNSRVPPQSFGWVHADIEPRGSLVGIWKNTYQWHHVVQLSLLYK